jgi:hypothetical protein
MKGLCTAFCILLACSSLAQKKDSAATKQGYKPEIFTNGFIDVMNNGQVNAAARLIRLYIGEPGKFAIPLSFYSGVSGNNFQNGNPLVGDKSNDHLVNNYINPLSGLINISTEGVVFFRKSGKTTKGGLLYHFGERILTGYKMGPITSLETGKATNFLNSFGSLGYYVQTGAWEKNNAKNVGVCWLAVRYIASYSNAAQIKSFLQDVQTNGIYHGYSLAFGIEINSLVNIKTVYYKYVKAPEIEYALPIYQFSFNYSFK